MRLSIILYLKFQFDSTVKFRMLLIVVGEIIFGNVYPAIFPVEILIVNFFVVIKFLFQLFIKIFIEIAFSNPNKKINKPWH